MELPDLNDLICELHPVTEIFLREPEKEKSVGEGLFRRWYPYENGTNGGLPRPPVEEDLSEIAPDPCKKLFDDKKAQLVREMRDKAAGPIRDPMPIMKHNAPRDTAGHEALATIGCDYFFGGAYRKFDPKCFLHGPIWAGDRITIRWSAKIVGPALIEDRVFINTSSVVKRSVVCANTQIDELAVLSDSIIGRDVYIEPGAKILHRYGRVCREIVVEDWRYSTRPKIETGRKKLGAVIGDGCHIGANAVIMPGTVLLPGCHVDAGRVLPSGIYTPHALQSGIAGLSHERSPNCS